MELPRHKGIGMPRPKKKAVLEPEQVEEIITKASEPAEPQPPPSPIPTRVRVVAPESPANSCLFAAQKEARRMARQEAYKAETQATNEQRGLLRR